MAKIDDYPNYVLVNGDERVETSNSEEFKEIIAEMVMENAYTRFNSREEGDALVVECL